MKGAGIKVESGLILGMMLTVMVCVADFFLDSIYIVLTGMMIEGVLGYSLYLCKKYKKGIKKKKERILEEKNEDLHWLKRIISHNIRMPLSIILGYSDYLIRNGELQKRDLEYMRKIYENTVYLKTVINQTLDREGEEEVYSFRMYDLAECVRETAGYVSDAAEKANICITVRCTQKIKMRMDKIQIIRLLYNLFENSIKYMGRSGEIIISVSQAEDQVLLVYRDDGKGMNGETLRHLFEKGYRENSGKAGSGLGMYFVNNVVKAHHGRIKAVSDTDKGVAIYIWFPVGDVESLANL